LTLGHTYWQFTWHSINTFRKETGNSALQEKVLKKLNWKLHS